MEGLKMAKSRQQNEIVKPGGRHAPDVLNVVEMGGRVEERIDAMMKDGRLFLPPNYSPQNAMKSAELIIRQTADRNGTPVLNYCTKESIYNALLDMVVQGLNPGKKQCYFIPYGNQLLLQRSYMGTISVAKRLGGVREVHANVVYFDDEFEYEIELEGGYKIIRHTQKIENIDGGKIKAAYAVVKLKDGGEYVEVMGISQIKKAWGQGATHGDSPAHRNFPDEMAKKTVINRACKLFINTSDDEDLLTESFIRTTDNEAPGRDPVPELNEPVQDYDDENARLMDAILFGAAQEAGNMPAKTDEPSAKGARPEAGSRPHEEAEEAEPSPIQEIIGEDALEEEIKEVFG
jgi:recombination protein RecT